MGLGEGRSGGLRSVVWEERWEGSCCVSLGMTFGILDCDRTFLFFPVVSWVIGFSFAEVQVGEV